MISRWFSRLKQGLSKTRDNIVGLFTGAVIDDDLLDELESSLVMADVGAANAAELVAQLRRKIQYEGLKTADEARVALRDAIAEILAPCQAPLDVARAKPFVMMVAGVNGAGKTTSIGKLSKWLSRQDKTVLLAAGDTFRAAAREQLAVWGERNRVQVVSQQGADPAAVVFDAISAGRARGIDVVIADTAGRLHTQANLMGELGRIARAAAKSMAGAPHERILVVDGTNGQNALAQVQAFDAAVGLTGLVITKLDGTAKGGVLVAIAKMRATPLPIYFIGVGEGIDDLQPFRAREFANALLGIEQ